MKIKVIHKNELIELLDIKLPVIIKEGNEKSKFNIIVDANGTDYYFYKTGEYDGWGRGVTSGTEVEAMDTLKEMNKSKKITPPNIVTNN